MEVSQTCKKLRHLLNPASLSFISLPKTLIPTLSATQNPKSQHTIPHSPQTLSSSLYLYFTRFVSFRSKSQLYIKPSYFTRGLTTLSKSNYKTGFFHDQHILRIVSVLKENQNDMELELDKMGLALSLDLINEVFWGLNTNGVSGLRFFNWVRQKQVPFYRSSDFCSFIIDNLGRVEDCNSMFSMMVEFSRERLCLTERAFAFLPNFSTEHGVVRDYVAKVTDMLNEVGGSCRNSGVFALIKLLCTFNSFDFATMVMEATARKTSYYNVLVWAKCRSCNFQEVYELFDEMRRFGCDPNLNSYNYLLGSLCKYGETMEACNLFQTMEELGYFPDGITFEVIICHVCRLGRLDVAVKFLNRMILRSIEPRHTTHAVIIKGYFYCDRFEEAYAYVADMCDKCKSSANMNYSLLASLLHKSRRVVEARGILVDMMEKGLKPNFPVYIKVMKDLHKCGMGHFVADLKSRFSRFH